MKLSAEVIAAKRRVGLIWLPTIRQREINRSGDHPVVDDSRQRGKQHLPIDRRTGLDLQFIGSA